jgi:hypothetical protein
MKKIDLSKFSIFKLPIIIIILCALGIYFIYYYKQKEYYSNYFEKFDVISNSSDNIQENFENNTSGFSGLSDLSIGSQGDRLQLQNALSNPSFTTYLARGDWTTNQSTFKNNKVDKLMFINIDNNFKGTIDLTSVTPGSKYNITNVSNMMISGTHQKNKNQSIILEFKNDFVTDSLNRDKLTEGFVGESIENFENEDELEQSLENFENETQSLEDELAQSLENFENEPDENSEDYKNKGFNLFRRHRRKKRRGDNGIDKSNLSTYMFIENYLKGKVDPQKIIFYFAQIKENKIKFRNLLRCKVSLYTGTSLNLEYYSYKVFDKNNTGGLLSRIIQSQQYFNIDVPMKHNLYLYNKYLKSYIYPRNMVSPQYSNAYNKNTESTFTNTLQSKYGNQLYIAYQREFLTIDNQVVRTPLSQPFIINVLNNRGQYFNNIQIKAISPNEKRLNQIEKNFAVKNTVVYFYKMIKQQNSYSFKNNNSEYKSQFNLRNDADKMFSKNKITFPNIFNTTNTNKSTYNLTLIKSYPTKNDNTVINIPYKDLKLLV